MLSEDDQGGVTGLADAGAQPPDSNAPEAPETPAASSPSPDAGLDSQPSDGQPRDEHGRFTSSDAQASTTDPSTPPDSAGAGAPAGPSDPSLPSPTPHEPSNTPAPVTPLTYRAGGREHTYEGAERTPDGKVVFKPEAYSRLLNDLAAAHTYQTTWRETLQRTKAESQQQVERATAQAQGYEAVAGRLLQQLEQFLDPREYQLLARELSLELQSVGAQPTGTPSRQPVALDGQPTTDQQQAAERLRFQAQQTLVDEVLTRIQHTPDFAALTPDQQSRDDLLNYFLETLPAYFTEQQGEVVLDTHKVALVLQREAKRIQAVADAKAAATKEAADLKAAMERNAATGKKPNVPPVVPAQGSPSPGSGDGTFKSKADWEAYKASFGLS